MSKLAPISIGPVRIDAPFDVRLQRLRPHPGQVASASNLRRLLEGSPILASHRDSEHLVQDAYSLRCAPQVHGATRDALGFAWGVLETELNAVSDNPIVLPDDADIVSGGNFHGQPVAVAMDALALATVGMASISERRLYRLLDPALSNGLPAFLGCLAFETLVRGRQLGRSSLVVRVDPRVKEADRHCVDVGEALGNALDAGFVERQVRGWTERARSRRQDRGRQREGQRAGPGGLP